MSNFNKPTEQHLIQAAQLWELKTEATKFLRNVENAVYSAETQQGEEVILRITEPSHREYHELQAEMDWIDFLSTNGMNVANPYRSLKQNLVEDITCNGQKLFASVFKKAVGKSLSEFTEFKSQMAHTWGAYLGKMHALTKNYVPPKTNKPRTQWQQDVGYQLAIRSLDPSDEIPYRKFHEILEWMNGLEKGREIFGLVHADFHHGNFFVKDGVITAFDFDDSSYHWFVYDLALPLFHVNALFRDKLSEFQGEEFRTQLVAGYRTENTLSPEWEQRIDGFLQYRTGLLYHWIKTRINEKTFEPAVIADCKKVLPWYVEQLKQTVRLL